MKNDIAEIKNYILFLKRECDLEITLHPFGGEQLISGSELAFFNIHENPHCVFVKTFSSAHAHCVQRQEKILEKCSSGSFCGTCYAGVTEYVYPIYDAKSVTGFVSVSGYRGRNYVSYAEKCSARFGIPKDSLCKTALSLKNEIPPRDYVDTLVYPLIRMLELSYKKMADCEYDSTGNIVLEIIKYVNRHYAEDITLEKICSVFCGSRSKISHVFKKETGKSFREYLIGVRISSATRLLLYSDLSVSEIAFSVGFNDSNYFSSTFKKYTGQSPVAYKKSRLYAECC